MPCLDSSMIAPAAPEGSGVQPEQFGRPPAGYRLRKPLAGSSGEAVNDDLLYGGRGNCRGATRPGRRLAGKG